ncbi:MAG: hypothetical protein ACOC1F_09985 [Myxococcota bacterium]
MVLRSQLQSVLDELLAHSAPGAVVSLDAIGQALGTMSVSIDEIDALLTGLESAGRRVGGADRADPKADLRSVMAAAHAMRSEGEAPTVEKLARRAGIAEERVRTALRLGQIMGR